MYYRENKGRLGERETARSLHGKLLQEGIVWRSTDYFRFRAAECADVKDSDSLAKRRLLLQIYFLIEVLSCTWSSPLSQWSSSIGEFQVGLLLFWNDCWKKEKMCA